MHIGLFTEPDSGAHSIAATVDALVAHRPHDCSIHRYEAEPDAAVVLRAGEFVRRADSDRIDLVHVATSGPLAIVALMVASRRGVPAIGAFQPAAASGIHRAYIRALSRRSRRTLAASAAARDALIRARVSPTKILLWRPGVDLLRFAPLRRSSALRDRWGVSEARPAVVYAGSLSDDRGARRLLSLEVALHRTRPMHQLIVAGDGPSRNEVQARCPNAIFLGSVPASEMPQFFASADLFVCPSEAVSTNLAVLEAQACGLPVVVMECGSARERAGTSAAVVCRSHADFIVGTAALIRTDERRKTMGLAAREHAIRQRWEAGLAPVYAEYRAAVAASRVRRDLEPAFAPQSRRL